MQLVVVARVGIHQVDHPVAVQNQIVCNHGSVTVGCVFLRAHNRRWCARGKPYQLRNGVLENRGLRVVGIAAQRRINCNIRRIRARLAKPTQLSAGPVIGSSRFLDGRLQRLTIKMYVPFGLRESAYIDECLDPGAIQHCYKLVDRTITVADRIYRDSAIHFPVWHAFRQSEPVRWRQALGT